MAYVSVNPVSGSFIARGDTITVTWDNGTLPLIGYRTTGGGADEIISSSTGTWATFGAGYTGVYGASGGEWTISFTRDAGWPNDNFNISMFDSLTNDETIINFIVLAEGQYPPDMQPFNDPAPAEEQGGGSNITVVNETTELTDAVTKFTYVGSGVVVTEPVPDSNEVVVTIPGGAISTLDDVITTGTPVNTVTVPSGNPVVLGTADGTQSPLNVTKTDAASAVPALAVTHGTGSVGVVLGEIAGATTSLSGGEIIMEDGLSTGVGTYAENGLEYAGDGVNPRNVGLGITSDSRTIQQDGVIIYGGNNTGTGDGGDVFISGGNATGGGDKGIVNIAPYNTSQILMGSTGCTLSIHDGTDTGASTHVLTSDGTSATWESSTGVGAQSLEDVITTTPIVNVVDVPVGNPIILRDGSVASNTPLTITKLVPTTTTPALLVEHQSNSPGIKVLNAVSGMYLSITSNGVTAIGDVAGTVTYGGGTVSTVSAGTVYFVGRSNDASAGDGGGVTILGGDALHGTPGDGGDVKIDAGDGAAVGSIKIGTINTPTEIEFGKGVTIGGDTARPLATTTADTGQFWVNSSGAISLPYFTGDDGVDIDLTSGSGVGDVTSSTTIAANKIVIGADGAKGVKQAPLGSLSDAGALTAIATIDTTGVITAGASLVSTTDLSVGTTAVIGSTLTMTAGNIVMSGGATVDGVDLGVKGGVWDDHAALVEEHIDWTLDYSATDVIHANNLASHTQQYTDMIGVPQFTILGKDTAGTGAADALTIGETRALLSLEPGTDVQEWSAVLDATTASFLIADETKLDFISASQAIDLDWISVTQAVDLDVIESDTAANSVHVAIVDDTATGNPHDTSLLNLVAGTYPQLKAAVPDAGEIFATLQLGQVAALTEKAVPNGTDWIPINDSSAAGGWKKASWPTQGGGDVAVSGTPATGNYARWTDAVTIEGRTVDQTLADLSLDLDLKNMVVTGTTAVSGSNTGDQTITLTGDVGGTGTGSFAATIANEAVTYVKMQEMTQTARVLGNVSGTAGPVTEITGADVKAMIDVFSTTSTEKGQVDGSNNLGNTFYLDGSGAWSEPTANGVQPAGSTQQNAAYFIERLNNVNTPAPGLAEIWVSNDPTQKLMFTDDSGDDINVLAPAPKGINVPDPVAETVWFFHTSSDMTLSTCRAIVEGGTSIPVTLASGPTYKTVVDTHVNAQSALVSATGGANLTIADATIAAGSNVWLTFGTPVGTQTMIGIQLEFA